jgi:hypothetical protein
MISDTGSMTLPQAWLVTGLCPVLSIHGTRMHSSAKIVCPIAIDPEIRFWNEPLRASKRSTPFLRQRHHAHQFLATAPELLSVLGARISLGLPRPTDPALRVFPAVRVPGTRPR